jgi:hypothetical protein
MMEGMATVTAFSEGLTVPDRSPLIGMARKLLRRGIEGEAVSRRQLHTEGTSGVSR